MPFAVAAVEHQHPVAGSQPQDLAEIARLRRIERDRSFPSPSGARHEGGACGNRNGPSRAPGVGGQPLPIQYRAVASAVSAGAGGLMAGRPVRPSGAPTPPRSCYRRISRAGNIGAIRLSIGVGSEGPGNGRGKRQDVQQGSSARARTRCRAALAGGGAVRRHAGHAGITRDGGRNAGLAIRGAAAGATPGLPATPRPA